MGDVATSMEKNIIPNDIDAILNNAIVNSVKQTREYQLGYRDGQMQLANESMKTLKREMVGPAEAFYSSLLKIIDKKCVLQHRIGLDYTTNVPTTLTIISHECANKIEDIRKMACDLELYIFEEHEYDCNFWVITDKGLEQELVDRDFPYLRASANVNT